MIHQLNSNYLVTPEGYVLSVRRGNKRLSPAPNNKGYLTVRIDSTRQQKTVHRLVASAFLPNPLGLPEVNHIDGDKTNNCVDNLEWCDSSHNAKHAYDLGLRKACGPVGKDHYMSALTEDDVRFIRTNYVPRHNIFGGKALADKYDVSVQTISHVVRRDTWKTI